MMWLRTAGARLASASAAAARQNARAAPIAFFSSSSSASSATAVGSTTTPKVNITNVVTPKRHRTAVTNLIWQKRGELGSQSSASDSLAVPHSLLPSASFSLFHLFSNIFPSETMHDSYMVTMLPFREDESLRDDYVNVSGNLRVGKLLEDLDAFAGSVAYLHCDDLNDASRPLTIVTASVDHIFLLKTLRADRNVRMRGHVTWVGRSSMEVTIAVEAEGEGEGAWDKLMYATFVMVARDAKTNKYARNTGRRKEKSEYREEINEYVSEYVSEYEHVDVCMRMGNMGNIMNMTVNMAVNMAVNMTARYKSCYIMLLYYLLLFY